MSFLWVDLRGYAKNKIQDMLRQQAILVMETYGSTVLWGGETIIHSGSLYFIYGPRTLQNDLNEHNGTLVIKNEELVGLSETYPDQLPAGFARANGFTHYAAIYKSDLFVPVEGEFVKWSRSGPAVDYPIVAFGTLPQ
ncbi:hypothetical protein LAV84_29175 [Rhizobium sp. VS19-DR104.2]|uniref:hypothetical protein n=1 Tax=unclassified Rhizobium TaxID=2613769 RepID=UPI001C5AF118|nr:MULTISPECIES: hypothetical protein [unclassified Rhizobium]MBZ5763553.1 hypothetical protein [Rhizobium sp. VS19-DR96]MBZ5769476.1 hypothetical protein [Rhizobium sp. VS19-DR129.2]MBZ5777011.1 hypothetical protein [Rhizobium sp. VS19-DRK62.2]MBZ5788147.1 hypothetical protein [Rhizobium sp. VS19-DR121]MBZ5805602.1 hypothetical protein [Rhizobium sp. VS19-DR181]